MLTAALLSVALAGFAQAEAPVYGQCGGAGWTGDTTCVSGSTCVYSNQYYSQCLPGAATATTAPPATTTAPSASAATGTVYLAGDSTMAPGGGGSGTDGWGQYLKYSLNLPVNNEAIAGRSARSFTREGRFTTIIGQVKKGDVVIIEFGHNDGGSLTPTDNGRTDCGGNSTETCQTTYNGVAETVLTFPAYLENAGRAIIAKGAQVIMSSQTPNNPWETGTYTYTPNRFTTYAQLAASVLGSGAFFVDHGSYVAQRFQALGLSTTDSYFPNDHTHTSPTGAGVVSAAFIKALLCGNTPLKAQVRNATSSVSGTCI